MAKTTNKKKLNMKIIENANKNQFTQKTVSVIVDGNEYDIIIDQQFKTTKIEKMVKNYLNSENREKFNELDEGAKIGYIMFLIIREFTDLEIPNNLKFEEEINLINSLIDLGVFEKIAQNIPESEIIKVNEFLQKFNENLNEIIKNENIKGKLDGESSGVDG
jgi:hypothetical protein